MKITYRNTRADLEALARLHLGIHSNRDNLIQNVFSSSLLYVGIFFFLLFSMDSVWMFLAYALCVALWFWWSDYRSRKHTLLPFLESLDKAPSDGTGGYAPTTLKCDEVGLHEDGQVYAWKELWNVVKEKDYLFVYVSFAKAFVVPLKRTEGADSRAFVARVLRAFGEAFPHPFVPGFPYEPGRRLPPFPPVEDLNQSEKEGGSAFVEGLKSGRWLFPIFIVGFALVSGVPRSWGNYYAKQVTSFRRAGDLQSAQESLDKAMLLAPTLPYVLSERALLLRAKNQPRRAFEVAEDLIRRHPRLPLGYVTKALLFQKSGQMADAEKMFLAAWKLAPRQGFSAFLMAILKEKTGLYQEAIVWLDREPQTGKMRWMIPTKKALLYIKLKQFTKATPMYRKALSWVPSKRRKCYVHRRVALAFFSVGANRKALAAIHRSMRIHPHEGINRLTRARIYYALGRQWAALRDVNAAIFRYGKGREDRALWTGRRRWTEAIFLRSNILISQHKYRRALRDVNLLIRMHPKKREYYHSRSLLWSKLGQKNKAASGLQGGTR